MKIYLLDNVDSFLTFKKNEDVRFFRDKFIGESIASNWKNIALEDLERDSKKYDISKISSNPVFSDRAVGILQDLLDRKAEILPYEHKTDQYYAINVTQVVDCIDHILVEIDHQKVVPEITRYAFKEQLIAEETVFKIPQYKKTRIYVTDRFRDRVLEAKLTGFKFWEVWDSEAPFVQEEPLNPLIFDGPVYSFKQAAELVEQGKTMASDKWVIQQHKNTMYLGKSERNGTFSWVDPIYIPPVLLDLKWYEARRIDIPEDV